jgi:hypothetical protein
MKSAVRDAFRDEIRRASEARTRGDGDAESDRAR